MNSPALKSRLCLAAFLLGVLFKFWLIWQTEISDALDDPHEYALQILYPINGGLAYPPGTGIIGRLFRDLHLPFRLGIEASFIVALILVVRSLFAWPWKSFLPLAVFLFVLFDPTLADLFSRLGSDEGWLVTTMIGAATFVLAWRVDAKPCWPLLAISALALGLSTITRSVIVPLLLTLIALTAFAAILIRAKRRHPDCFRLLGELALGIWTLVLGVLLIYESTCIINYRVHGYDGISIIDSTQYKKFYLTLESVGQPIGERYFSIDHDRRNIIAQAGPVSKWLMNELDHNERYKKVGFDHFGTSDIPSGWFEFAVFNAALPAAHGDLRECFGIFATVEQEIAQARVRGIIPVRTIMPLPDNRVPIVEAEFPGALVQTFARILYLPPPDAFAANPGTKAYIDPDFTAALTRRAVEPSPVRDQIWRALDALYAVVFTPILLCVFLVLMIAFSVMIVFRWFRFPTFRLFPLAQQIYLVFFIMLGLWYALFDASGRPVVPRYMIFNHLLLPLLLAYYAAGITRLFQSRAP